MSSKTKSLAKSMDNLQGGKADNEQELDYKTPPMKREHKKHWRLQADSGGAKLFP